MKKNTWIYVGALSLLVVMMLGGCQRSSQSTSGSLPDVSSPTFPNSIFSPSTKQTSNPHPFKKGETIAVIAKDLGGSGPHLQAMENLVVTSLKDLGLKVVNPTVLEKLKKEELLEAAIQNKNAMFFQEIGKKYQTDWVFYIPISAEAQQAIGRHWLGTSLVTGHIVSTKTSEIFKSSTSPILGTPDNPTAVGGTQLEAQDQAIRLSLEQVLRDFDLPTEIGGVPRDIRISLKQAWGKNTSSNPTTTIAFSLSNLTLASGHEDGSIILWNTKNGSQESQIPSTGSPIQGMVPDLLHGHLIAWDTNNQIFYVDLNTKKSEKLWQAPSSITAITISKTTPLLGIGTADGEIFVLSLDNTFPPQQTTAHKEAVTFISFSSSTQPELITASEDLSVSFWDPRKLQRAKRTLQQDVFRGEITHGGISQDGVFLALGIKDVDIDLLRNRRTDTRKVKIIRTNSGEEVQDFRVHRKDLTTLSFGPTRRILATASEESILKIWDTELAKEILNVRLDSDSPIQQVSFSPDGLWMAANLGDRLNVWSIR